MTDMLIGAALLAIAVLALIAAPVRAESRRHHRGRYRR